ncbi:MAG: MarR family transcriptional regulator [Promethearchaeota archaeon]|jgi:DNA-binding MarR family transcriptional regulator
MIRSDTYALRDYSSRVRLNSLPPSCKFILYILKRTGPLNQQDIMKKSLLPKRTVVFSLKKLSEENFIKKFVDSKDKRVRIYEILI